MITFIFSVHLLIWIFAQMRRLFVVYLIEMDFLITPCLVCFIDFIISHNLTMLLLFQDLRIATTVAVVIVLFVICWTPFFGINFAFAVCIATLFKGACCPGLMTLPTWILSVNKWLHYGNSVCNPVIYGFGNKDFRRAFRKSLLGLCCKRCGCQITARTGADAQYEVLTYGENQALKTHDQSSSLPTYRLECLTCETATVRRYKADAASRLGLNLRQRKVWQMICYG